MIASKVPLPVSFSLSPVSPFDVCLLAGARVVLFDRLLSERDAYPVRIVRHGPSSEVLWQSLECSGVLCPVVLLKQSNVLGPRLGKVVHEEGSGEHRTARKQK